MKEVKIMENILIEMIDVKKFLEISNIFKKRINIENDEEVIENLKDEWFGDYWDMLCETISSLDKKSAKTFNTKEGDILKDFINKLDSLPFRQHEFNKIVNKAYEDYYKKIENCKDKDYDPKIDFYAPKIDFFIKNNGERGFEIQEENYPIFLESILNEIDDCDYEEDLENDLDDYDDSEE